jgi:sugar lactone lactonase YvrE
VSAALTGLEPARVLPGARLALVGRNLPVSESALAAVTMGGVPARVVFASSERMVVQVPSELEGGPTEIKAAWSPGTTPVANVGRLLATGLHQVDSPAVDAAGRVYATYSGSRGQEVPICVFRVTPDGTREPLVTGIANPTSLAIGPDQHLYVSSRFEGAVYRVFDDGRFESVATDLGVPCGLAFGRDGALFVGDRSGTIFRIERGHVTRFATLPSSIAAFHLAVGPDDGLYVAAPTLAPNDRLYRIEPDGVVRTLDVRFGRPQGLAFDPHGTLHVVEALAGSAGVYRFHQEAHQPPSLAVAGPGVIGVTFGSDGALIVATSDSIYRFES